MGFGKDPNELYIMAEHEGRNALMMVDLRDPSLKRTVKLASATNDVSGSLVYSKTTGEPVGLASSNTFVQSEISYWNADSRALIASVNEALPGRNNRIISTSADENQYLVYSSNDRVAGEIYLGNHRANSLGLLVGAYPQLQEQYLVPKKAITVKARDNLDLPGYISTPPGSNTSNLPTVLLVNGGPQVNSDGSFNLLTQFLANRGYAVLQINSRGSGGFGSALRTAGLQKWGQEMQNDLNDGLNWAVAAGMTDPKRVCIVGAAYGGYAALMGVAKTPEAFKCAVSFAGVTDLVALGGDRGQYMSGKELFEAQVGSLDKDGERLRENSPRFLAKQIKSPVMLVHGTEDRNVSIYQGEYMDTALTEAGVPHKYIKQVRGDHFLSFYEHRMQFFTELESFLGEHLGVGVTR
jgi:dipeptidyl aminopeptidase/acylaminoacyl peptidase